MSVVSRDLFISCRQDRPSEVRLHAREDEGNDVALEWSAESLRLSLFSSGPVLVGESDWQRLTGQEMSEFRQIVPNGIAYSGSFDAAQLTVSSVGPRIDIILNGSPVAPASEPTFATIGPWEETKSRFLKFTSAWLADEKLEVVRLAFGAALMLPTQDAEETLARMSDLVPSLRISEGMQDPSFRVNWPQISSVVEGMLINRVTSWSGVQVVLPILEARTGSVSQLQLQAMRLEIDHNTDPRHMAPFNRDQLMGIYAELVEMASENASKGERP